MKNLFFWNVSVNKTVHVIDGVSELFWYGVSIGNFGIGLLVNRPTPLAGGLACTCAKVRFYPDENVFDEACPIHGTQAAKA